MTIGAVQAQPYYDDRMDNDYNSYGPPEYPSYKPDYKPAYLSYDGKDDKRDKSKKDSIQSVDVKTIKCINTNLNINGNNAGNISIGNKSAAEGSVGGYSSDDSGYGDKRDYDGYNNNKQDKDFDCIINNNNNNTNVVGGGNITDGGGNVTEPQTCEECFRAFLTEEQIDIFLGSETLEGYCDDIESGTLDENEVRMDLAGDASMADINAIIECLQNLGILPL